jgi:hypothetical protein
MLGLARRGALITCLMLWPWAVRAQTRDDSSYSKMVASAIAEYDAGRLVEARALFMRAHQLQPSARTLRGLGLVEFDLRHYAEATRLLSLALEDTRVPLTDQLKKETAALVQQSNVFVGRYRLVRSPADASLTIDGTPSPTPVGPEVVLDVGDHLLAVEAPGYRAVERRLDVKGGEKEELRFALVPNSAPTLPPPTAAEPQEDVFGASATPAPVKAPERAPEDSVFARRSTWGWVSLGLTVAAAAGTIVAWRVGESAAERWNDDARCLANDMTRQENCGSDQHTTKVARTWTTAGLITTGVFAVATTVLLWPVESDDRPRNTAKLRCGAGPGELGVACAVVF